VIVGFGAGGGVARRRARASADWSGAAVMATTSLLGRLRSPSSWGSAYTGRAYPVPNTVRNRLRFGSGQMLPGACQFRRRWVGHDGLRRVGAGRVVAGSLGEGREMAFAY
jgi:hypothetical protein